MHAVMKGASRLETASIAVPVLAGCSLAALVRPGGYIADPVIALLALGTGLVSSALALVLGFRSERPSWLRWVASGEVAAFTGAAAWLVHFASTVPFG